MIAVVIINQEHEINSAISRAKNEGPSLIGRYRHGMRADSPIIYFPKKCRYERKTVSQIIVRMNLLGGARVICKDEESGIGAISVQRLSGNEYISTVWRQIR